MQTQTIRSIRNYLSIHNGNVGYLSDKYSVCRNALLLPENVFLFRACFKNLTLYLLWY